MLKATWSEAEGGANVKLGMERMLKRRSTKVVCYHAVLSRTACNDKIIKGGKKL